MADRAVIVQAITGLGGVGKTQLAARYAHAHASNYDLVAWIRAQDGGLADLAQLAAKLDEPCRGFRWPSGATSCSSTFITARSAGCSCSTTPANWCVRRYARRGVGAELKLS